MKKLFAALLFLFLCFILLVAPPVFYRYYEPLLPTNSLAGYLTFTFFIFILCIACVIGIAVLLENKKD